MLVYVASIVSISQKRANKANFWRDRYRCCKSTRGIANDLVLALEYQRGRVDDVDDVTRCREDDVDDVTGRRVDEDDVVRRFRAPKLDETGRSDTMQSL